MSAETNPDESLGMGIILPGNEVWFKTLSPERQAEFLESERQRDIAVRKYIEETRNEPYSNEDLTGFA
jgi:hypothetical protein